MAHYILNAAGFVIGTFDGDGAPPGGANTPPPEGAALPLQFLDGAWVMAPVPVTPPTWVDAPAEYWWIDVGPFFDRFGDKAIVITSSEDSVVRGLLTLITPRKFIDLKRPDLPGLLDILVTKELIAQDDVARILTTPTTEAERYVKGLPQPEDA